MMLFVCTAIDYVGNDGIDAKITDRDYGKHFAYKLSLDVESILPFC